MKLSKTYWIGKTKDDVLGHKIKEEKYILSTLENSFEEADGLASFLCGFGGYQIVEVEIIERKEKHEKTRKT